MTPRLPANAPTAGIDTILSLMIAGLLAVQLASLATFNHQPDKLLAIVEAASFVGFLVVLTLTPAYAGWSSIVHYLGLALFAGAGLISYARHPEHAQFSALVKNLPGPMLLSILTLRRTPAPASGLLWGLWWVAVGAAFLGAMFAFTGPAYMNGDSRRLAVFAGGSDGLHPSAYATAAFMFTLMVLYRARVGFSLITLAALAVTIATILGYQVRTSWVMILVFFGFLAAFWLSRRSVWVAVGAVGIGVLLATLVLFVLTSSHFDVAHFSSGRTVIYAERFRMVMNRELGDFLFGSGSGTDLMRGVDAWRWEAKDSHNDLMNILIEEGLVGLVGFLIMIGAAFWAAPWSYKGWPLMMAVTAVISNGVLLRPSIAPPLILAAYLALALRNRVRLPAPAVPPGQVRAERQSLAIPVR